MSLTSEDKAWIYKRLDEMLNLIEDRSDAKFDALVASTNNVFKDTSRQINDAFRTYDAALNKLLADHKPNTANVRLDLGLAPKRTVIKDVITDEEGFIKQVIEREVDDE